MKKVTISLDDKEVKILTKRAKNNLFSLTEQIEDIIRRSCVNSANRKNFRGIKVDDKLVGIFSRQKSGRKSSKKKKGKKKK